MCGIFGCSSVNEISSMLYTSLRKLEYRGYDSFGVATSSPGGINAEKSPGKISEAVPRKLPGRAGIAHTRWATHGSVNEANAHPHIDCSGSIAVAHNGIIENFQELRRQLETRHRLASETDSELISHLIEEEVDGEGLQAFKEAVRRACGKIEGRYAIVAIFKGFEGVIGIRKGSPLIIGRGKSENYIASDIPAFLDLTRDVMYLDDGEMAVLMPGKVEFFRTATGEPVEKRLVRIEWEAGQAEKGEYSHYMLKEIMEQKETLYRAINQDTGQIMDIARQIRQAFGTFFIGCGTAGRVCLVGEYAFSKIAGKHVNFILASEFPNYKHFLTDKTLVIAVSQSGETADVLEAVESAREKGSKVISIVNAVGSSLERASDHVFHIKAGPEKAVASTKATTAQIALVTLLSYALAGRLEEGRRLLVELAGKVNDMLNPRYEERIRNLALKLSKENNIYIIGRGMNYPMALESAIKIQEVSYIHAEGFAGGELKHGPIALIEKGTPCVALVAKDGTEKEIIGNCMEIRSRGGYIIGVSPENNDAFDFWIRVPDVGMESPIANIIPIQMLAYHLALLRGNDPDYPKNLAKSVTVK